MNLIEIEVIIEKKNIPKDKIKERLKNLGSSLTIGEIKNFYKIHIHTNCEEKVLKEIEKISKIIQIRKTYLPFKSSK